MLSDSPPERKLEWTSSGIDGSNKYLIKIWNFFKKLKLSEVSFYEDYDYKQEKNKNLIENSLIYRQNNKKSG